MLVLKTTSPVFSPENPKDLPSNTVPSSRANTAFCFDIIRGSLRVASAFIADESYSVNEGAPGVKRVRHDVPIKKDPRSRLDRIEGP
jgi:hypothetical protein